MRQPGLQRDRIPVSEIHLGGGTPTFLTPAELARALRDAGLDLQTVQGVTYSPLRGDWRLGNDTDINYMMVATKQA